MIIKKIIDKKPDVFNELCRNHQVKRLYAFGSSVSQKFDEAKSDIDLVVDLEEIDPIKKGEKLISLWDNFEIFFRRKVDLLTEKSIANPYLKESIDSSKVLIYEGKI
jgi:hypothetical protein